MNELAKIIRFFIRIDRGELIILVKKIKTIDPRKVIAMGIEINEEIRNT